MKGDKLSMHKLVTHNIAINIILLAAILSGCSTAHEISRKAPIKPNYLAIAASSDPASDISNSKKTELYHLLKQDCGSCHGMTLKGGLGPALTKDRMSGFSSDYLFETIWNGREIKAMPPWKNILLKKDVRWLVKVLQAGAD
jgi:cytochrome c55X